MGYPEALFAGAPMADLKSDFDAIQASISIDADGKRITGLSREAGVFDPAVTTVRIAVAVKLLSGDLAPYGLLYETEREMANDRLVVPLTFEPHATLDTFTAAQPSNGPLVLPTAREVRLTFTALGIDTPGYFASADARLGTPIDIIVRREADAEGDLLLDPPAPQTPLQAFFFQPPAPGRAAGGAARGGSGSGRRRPDAAWTSRPADRNWLFGRSAPYAVVRTIGDHVWFGVRPAHAVGRGRAGDAGA